LLDAIDYIARDSPSYAAALAVRAERAAISLQEFPHRGRRVGEFNDPDIRELAVANYRLIYLVCSSKVVLLVFISLAISARCSKSQRNSVGELALHSSRPRAVAVASRNNVLVHHT